MTPQTVLVTGSSSGLGRMTAVTLARQGHTVFASMRGVAGKNAAAAEALRALAQSEGLALGPLELDVTDDASVQAAVAEIVARAGRVDVLVNNAGFGLAGIAEATSVGQVQQQFEVNFFGVLRVNQAVLPHMRRQRSGLLVYLSSTASRMVFPPFGLYSASKAALDSAARAFDADVRGFGIDTTIVQAGLFATDFGANIVGGDRADVNAEYGPLGEGIGAYLSSVQESFSAGVAGDPQELADLIAEVVALPQGQRPLYAAAGLGTEQIHIANQGIHEYEHATLRFFGAGALVREATTHRPAAAAPATEAPAVVPVPYE